MKTKILVTTLFLLLVGCSDTKDERTTICSNKANTSSYELVIESVDGIVVNTKQTTKTSLETFSKEEKTMIQQEIQKNELNSELKDAKGVSVKESLEEAELSVVIKIDFAKSNLKQLNKLRQIDVYNVDRQELRIDQMVTFQQEYYKVTCMEEGTGSDR